MSAKRSNEGVNAAPPPLNRVIPKLPDLTILDEIEGKLWIGYQGLLSTRSFGQLNNSQHSLGEVIQITFAVIKEIRAEAMRSHSAGRPPIGL